MHPTVPAAPISPNHCFDSFGFSTPTANPQNNTIGVTTATSQTMYVTTATTFPPATAIATTTPASDTAKAVSTSFIVP